MINFDGAILMDIMSMSGPPYGSDAPDTVDGVDIYKYTLIPEADRYERLCEGCGASPWNGSMFNMYDSWPVQEDFYHTMALVLSYCQRCMEDLKQSYDEDPMQISAHGKIPGAPWWQPLFVSGHAYGVWKEFSE